MKKVCMFATNDLRNDPRVSRHAETLAKHGYDVTVVCTKTDRTPLEESVNRYRIVHVKLSNSRILVSLFRLARAIFILLYKVKSRGKVKVTRHTSVSSMIQPPPGSRHTPAFYVLYNLFKRNRFLGELLKVTSFALFFHDLFWRFTAAGRHVKADIYVSNDFDTLLVGILCAGLRKPLIYDAHEIWPDQYIGLHAIPDAMIHYLSYVEAILIRRANIVMTVNPFIAAELQRRYHLKQTPQVVLNIPL